MDADVKDKIYHFGNFPKNKINCHLFFISFLLMHYLFSFLLFGNITLFYHDVLDAGVVYNYILGKFYTGDLNSIDNFLGGSIKYFYLQSIFKPYSLIYSFFNTELAYWLTDFAIKLTSYFAFFTLSERITKNFFICSLVSCVYAFFNSNALGGFGIAIFPYLIYLGLFKNNLNTKEYLILTFFGLNSDLVSSLFLLPVYLFIIYFYDKNIFFEKKLILFKIIILFYISMTFTNLNLFYIFFTIENFHRVSFFKETPGIFENLKNNLFAIFYLPQSFSWILFKQLPYSLIVIPVAILSLISRNFRIKSFIILIISYFLIKFCFDLQIFENIKNSFNFLKSYKTSWVEIYIPFIYAFLLLLLLSEKKFQKFLIFISFVSIFVFQINSSIVPFYKKNITSSDKPYKNIYTFKGYYSAEKYKEIKKIVKENRVISVGLDPMVAVMNDIKVIDGYHNLYPKDYKIKFREIIENELLKNEELLKYYDNWGNRVYAFVSDPNNIELNFSVAKGLGAKYVISKYQIKNESTLKKRCKNCETDLFLYEIL